MVKAKGTVEGQTTTLVEVSPGQLREIANLLELSAGKATQSETALVPLTDKITLAYAQKGPVKEAKGPQVVGAPYPLSDQATKGYVDQAR